MLCAWQATSGLGATAAYALSKEGFHVVLGNMSHHYFKKLLLEQYQF